MDVKSKVYRVGEDEIVRISYLFGCLENAIKEIIRHQARSDDMPEIAEMTFYEEASRVFYERDDSIEYF